MMPARVPFTGGSRQAMSITIAGRSLRLRADYANLTNTWRLDIFDNAGESPVPLAVGIPILMGVDLVKQYRLGIGSLYAEPNARPRDDAGRGELGSRINLVHYAPGEAIP